MRPVKMEELKELETITNNIIKNKDLKISINPRYDYLGIDLYGLKEGNLKKTLMTGNKKEVYFYLSGFIDFQDLISKEA